MERPKATFCYGKHCVLNHFCCAEFLAYYTLENKSTKTCEYLPDELDNNLIENNHEECSYIVDDFNKDNAVSNSKMSPNVSSTQ